MMRRGKVGLLSARGGTGKSAALCGLALAVRTGKPWLQEPMRAGDQGAPGFGVDPGARGGLVALLMGEEDLPELDRRLWKAAELMGLDAAERRTAAAGLVVAPLAGVEAALVEGAPGAYALGPRAEALCAELEARAEALGGVWSAVLLDPLSRFGGPACETDNAAATLAIQALERLTQLPGKPAVLVAHHERKGGGDGADAVRGASALVDGARWVGRLTVVQAPDKERRGEVGPYRPVVDGAAASMVRLEVAKTNYTGPMEPRLLTVAGGGIRAARKAERDELAAVLAEAAAEKKAPPTKKDTKKARPTDPGV
jgi:RecA-family ATPase